MTRLRLKLALLGSAMALFAATPAVSLPGGACPGAYRDVVMGEESSKNYSVLNSITGSAAGAYQFIPSTLADLGYVSSTNGRYSWSSVRWTNKAAAMGVHSLSDFLNTSAGHALQDQAFAEFTSSNFSRFSSTTHSSLGRTVRGVRVTHAGLLSASHFLGAGGLNQFVGNGFTSVGLNNLSAILRQNGFASAAELDRYVMSRIKNGAAAHSGECGGSVPSGMGQCLQVAIMSGQGEAAMSPFGVDRTGRTKTGGPHLGLDIINGVGRGDPILAGLPGKIALARIDATNSVFMEVAGGRQQVGYLHGDSIHVTAGQTVAATDRVIDMGAKGAGAAVHLHLYVALRGDVIASAAESVGTVWPQGNSSNYWGSKRSTPLSGASLRGAAPEAFYMVNPETFLHHQIPWNPGILTVQQYKDQGFSRPDGMTLPPTCSPTADTFDRGGLPSTNGGLTSGQGFSNGGAILNAQTNANLASVGARDAVLEGAEYSISALQQRQSRQRSSAHALAAWAGMMISVMENNY